MISIQLLEPGARLKLRSDAVVEVFENPRDGTWLVAKAVRPDGSLDATTELVHVDDVVAQVESES
jgi:hypothetical protein